MDLSIERVPMHRHLLLALVFLATFLVYLPGLSGGFLFDDLPNITHNSRLAMEKLDGQSLMTAALSSQAGRLKRPVSMLSLALNRHFLGEEAKGFKAVNLAIHLLTGLMLFVFLQRLLLCFPGVASPHLLALATTAAWLLHPLNLSPVLYVVQRMTSLAALFVLAGGGFYLWARARRFAGQGSPLPLFLALPILTILATLSKENGALLPLFLFLVEIACFGFKNQKGEKDRAILGLFTLFLFLPTLLLGLYFLWQPEVFLRGYGLRAFGLEERVLTQGPALFFYLRLLLLPDPRLFALFHDNFPLSTSLWQTNTLLAWFLVAGLLFWSMKNLASRALTAFGVAWFFAGHVMESTILPLELVHEHRNYLPSAGILLAFMGFLLSFGSSYRLQRLVRGFALALVTLFALITLNRSVEWSDNDTLFLLEAEHHPDSPRAVFEAGRTRANHYLQGKSPSPDEAFRLLKEASQLDKDSSLPETTLMVFAEKARLPRLPVWLEAARDKLANRPMIPSSFIGLQELLECQAAKTCTLSDQEILSLLAAMESNPALSRLEESVLTLFAGYLIEVKGDLARGIGLLERSLAVATDPANARLNLAWALLAAGRLAEARDMGQQAETLDSHGRLEREIGQLKSELLAAEKNNNK